MTIEGVVLIVLAVWALRALFVWTRGRVHRWRLPEPSLAPGRLEMSQGLAFRAVCRLARNPGPPVNMRYYFIEQDWNRADAMLVLSEALKHDLIRVRGWRFGSYSVTRKGWAEYQSKFIWTGGEGVNISSSSGGFVVANVGGHGSVVHGGYGNQTNVGAQVSHQQLIEALRADAETATPDEAVRAREYADDLASAVEGQDQDRTARVLGRINTLLTTASAAFTLTRQFLPPGS
ncbi:hypothetical protein [Streptomyces sp. NPDC048659]|uniref:hypothetical protein n=1 Tax=Streptomyces sp. NPDC048659 TaxID=3155489 RepID=UPI003417EE98